MLKPEKKTQERIAHTHNDIEYCNQIIYYICIYFVNDQTFALIELFVIAVTECK